MFNLPKLWLPLSILGISAKQATLFVLVGLLFILCVAQVGAAAVDITPDNLQGWSFALEGGTNGSGQFVTGPSSPPAGTGSAQLVLTAADTSSNLRVHNYGGTRLADIDAMSYWTYRSSGNSDQAPALEISLDLDVTDANTDFVAWLAFTPSNNGSPATDSWQEWDVINGGDAMWGVPGATTGCTEAIPCTLTTILSGFPNIGINADPANANIRFRTGDGWTNFEGNVDDFSITIGGVTDTYNFDNLPVNNITQGTSHATIQDAVDNANSGDTLVADPGTYSENVVVDKSLTLRGAGAGTDPLLHTILDGSSFVNPTTSGIHVNANVTDVVIEDLTVQNYTLINSNYAGISGASGNDNFTVRRVHALNNTSGRGGVYLNGPVDTVLIDNVTAHDNQGRGIVIWNGFKTNITITNNDVRRNNCCGIELQDGTASGVTMSGNTVVDNADSGMSAIGLMSGAGPNVIAGNTVTDNGRFGIEIKLPNGTGLASGDGSIVVQNNIVSRTGASADARDLAGISVYRRGWVSVENNVDIPVGVILQNNTVSGYQQTTNSDGFGIVVEGTNMSVLNNTLNSNDVGIQVQSGHLPYTPDTDIDGDQSNLNDDYFGRGNSPVACATVSGNIHSSNGVDERNVGANAGSNPTVYNQTANTYHCSIQQAIDAATASDTIQVPAGIYVEDLTIDKPLTLQGPNVGIDPNTGVRVPEAVLLPATSNPDPAVCSIMAYLETSDITIDGFTFDGDNPALTSGIIIGAADVDACEILAGYEGMGNITVENNILQHSTYSGIDFYNYFDNAATSDNYIRNNLIRHIGETTYNWGIGILIYNNFYADISNNVLENVRVGIQTGNYHRANPGTTGQISQNEVNAWRLGIFHNLWYSNASLISVDNNTINAIDSAGSATWNGMLISSWQNTANTLIVDNDITIGNITQLASGYNVWNTPTTAALTISGGTITGGDYGVFVNNYDGYNSDANDTSILMDNVTIADAEIAGVYVKDNPANSNNATVSATVQNSTINNSTATAVQVEGADAAATVKGSEIDGTDTVFNLNAGSLLAYANNIDNFTTGVNYTSGTLNARHNWWGNITPVGVNDIAAFDYRLGAAVAGWNDEGTLGGATLTSAGGGGTGVIVSHGRGLANVPFGKGNDPYASATCSDYYDFFVLNASGDWTVSVPVDAAASCDDTLADNALFQFALSGTMPDTGCTGGACWEPPAGVGPNGRSLEVTLDAPTYLLGTPFVAGDATTDNNDPTAVSLSSFSAATNNMGRITAVILLLITLTTVMLWKRRTN